MAVVLQNPHNFEVGTTVRHGEPARYGVIKWMGILPDKDGIRRIRNGTQVYSISTYTNFYHHP